MVGLFLLQEPTLLFDQILKLVLLYPIPWNLRESDKANFLFSPECFLIK